MKKYIILLFTGFSLLSMAKNPFPPFFLEDCDACGCSATGGSMGLNSMLSESFIGFRYIHQSYKSRDGVFNNSPWIDENFNSVQLWTRIPVSERIEFMALLPYHFNRRVKSASTQNLDGIGDITVLGFYNVLKTQNDFLNLSHKLQLGLGVKAPTGTYDEQNNGSVNPSFQLGTGSWDYTLASEYIFRKNDFGFNGSLHYILKTENDKKYKFGDQVNYGATFFYVTEIKQFTFVPQLGISGEVYQANEDYSEKVPFTKGDILFGKFGFETGYKDFSLGVNAMLPISQNLTGGRVEANYRLALSLNYTL